MSRQEIRQRITEIIDVDCEGADEGSNTTPAFITACGKGCRFGAVVFSNMDSTKKESDCVRLGHTKYDNSPATEMRYDSPLPHNQEFRIWSQTLVLYAVKSRFDKCQDNKNDNFGVKFDGLSCTSTCPKFARLTGVLCQSFAIRFSLIIVVIIGI